MLQWHQPTYVHSYQFWRVCPRILVLIFLALMLPMSGTAVAKVTGPCSNCHTMHYSQNNTILAEWDEGGPHQALLTSDCVGCHTGQNVEGGDTPFVTDTSEPTYGDTGTEGNTTTLAGGSFYWVEGDNTTGHNVEGICLETTYIDPPGYEEFWPNEQKVTCAGTYGCHGAHAEANQTRAIHGAHHGNLGGARTDQVDSPATGYRFLVGIEGYEDPEWEFTPTAAKRNQYKGTNRPETADSTTISSLCARCHGQYHGGTGSVGTGSPWLRHPTDYDMSKTGEYANYGDDGTGVNYYNPAVPVAISNISSTSPLSDTVSFTGDTIVTCVSCHRAHGSPYYKAMRWDYAGSANGDMCSECHSSKK